MFILDIFGIFNGLESRYLVFVNFIREMGLIVYKRLVRMEVEVEWVRIFSMEVLAGVRK